MSTSQISVVTGTSTGFGYDVARLLAQSGRTVYGTMREVAGRNAEPARALGQLGVTVVEMDVTDEASVDRGVAKILDRSGRVDVLVNNAGTAHFGLTEAHTPASLERQLATNVVGPFRLARAFLPGMREHRNGLIVVLSSAVGRMTMPFNGIYASSKWAIEAMFEAMSYELRPFDIDVALIEPGAYATNIGNAIIAPDDAATLASYGDVAKKGDEIRELLPSIAGDPIDVAEAIVALIDAKPGTRPLRTVLPLDSPIANINASVAPIQRAILEGYGLGAFLAPELQTAK